MLYLWIKALHIVSVVCWFAGLFYLPRLFVYHAQSQDSVSQERFVTMERKLFRGIMNPAMIATYVFGAWMLYITPGWLSQGLAACQADPGHPADRLPSHVRRPAQALRQWQQHPQPRLLPLVQRGTRAVPAGYRNSGGGQTVLT